MPKQTTESDWLLEHHLTYIAMIHYVRPTEIFRRLIKVKNYLDEALKKSSKQPITSSRRSFLKLEVKNYACNDSSTLFTAIHQY